MDAAQTNDEIGAIQALKDAGWDMDAAFEYYSYSARSRSSKKSSTNAAGIDKMFETYKVHDDQKEERIEAEGIIKLLEDLGVDPFDPVTLVLSLKMAQRLWVNTPRRSLHEEWLCWIAIPSIS